MKLRIYLLSTFVVFIALSSAYSQWVHMSDIGGGAVNCLAVKDTIIYAGTDKGLFISTSSSGTGWTTTPSKSRITSLLISGENIISSSLSTGTSSFSADNGTTWNPCNTGALGEDFISLVANGTTLFGGTDGSGIFRSTDNGFSWKLTSPVWSYYVACLAVLDADIFAGTNTGIICCSSDNGSNWRQLNTGLHPFPVTSLATVGLHLYAGTANGVTMSTNGGTSWSNFIQNGPVGSSYSTNCLAVSGFTLFQGNAAGVYYLNDGDTTWKYFNTGLTTYVGVEHLLVCGKYLYALAIDNGLYRRALSDVVTSVNGVGAGVPVSFELSQNYPNPFNPSTTIRYDLPKSTNVTLRIFNTLGQTVATLVDERREAGHHQVQWNANVPSGIYFYRLQAGEFVETKKMILLK